MDNKDIKEARRTSFSGIQISEKKYNIMIGLTIIWGILINIIMAFEFMEPILQLPFWSIIVAYFIGSFIFTLIIYKSDNPVISFVGFTGLSISMGLLLTYYITFFKFGDIRKAFVLTGAITLVMLFLSTIYSDFFKGLGKFLTMALILVIIAQIIMMFIGYHPTFFDWGVSIIFCAYIGYDWAMAQSYPPTIDHAIDSAADIYVDVVNLFIRILSILGSRKR